MDAGERALVRGMRSQVEKMMERYPEGCEEVEEEGRRRRKRRKRKTTRRRRMKKMIKSITSLIRGWFASDKTW